MGDLIALTETRYTDARGEHHEINLVFDVSVRGVEPRSLEPHIEFRWAEQSELHGLEVRPVPIAQVVRTQFDGPRLPLLTEGFNEEELQE